MIKKSSIENLKHHVDLYQLISDYVSLQKSGSSWKGLSPFTQEKTPSFHVYPDRGFYYCFSTSQGGDAIKFLQVKENFSFSEAVEALADRFNFKLEYEKRDGKPYAGPTGGQLKRLKLIHEQASKYYQHAFWADTEDARSVRAYWCDQRGFTEDDAKAHGIGMAPTDGGAFYQFLVKQSFSDKELEASGLFFPRGHSTRSSLTARFRGRLMVPICDLTGNVIAFTGRKLDITPENDPAFEAKYVNSPKTDLFNKGTLLFGIHIARKAVSEDVPFVMVEGQIDAIRCWTQGFEQVLATQGTAITDIQLGKLKNYCSQLIMCLDGDSAGTKAALRVLPMAMEVGLDVRFIRLSPGDDPDTFLMREGADKFKELLLNATPTIAFMVDSFFDPDKRDGASMARAAESCFEMISRSRSQITKIRMMEDLSSMIGLELRSLQSDFEDFEKRTAKKRNRQGFQQPGQTAGVAQKKAVGLPKQDKKSGKLRTVESDLLRLLIQHAALRQKVLESDFSELVEIESIEGQMLLRICAEIRENPGWAPEKDADLVCENEAEQNLIFKLLTADSEKDDTEDLFDICLKSMQLRYDKKRQSIIEHKLNRSVGMDNDELNALLTEKLEIQRRIANQKG